MRKVFILSMMFLGVALAGHAQVFEFRLFGQALVDHAIVTFYASADSFFPDAKSCRTNPPPVPKDGLVLAVLDGSEKEASATLTIKSNSLQAQMIQWCMGGLCELMDSQTTLTKSFVTSSDGLSIVDFDATEVTGKGSLEAELSVTIDGESRVVVIKFEAATSTGISSMDKLVESVKVYDMLGVPVTSPRQKGVYIRHGKKVLYR